MSKNKIAFLFLIIDNPNFPKIWDYYFKDNYDKINIYIHPKYPHLHTWKPECIINNLQQTGWGYIVNAYLELFKTAYQNKDNVKFITISESCLPIKPFNEFYEFTIKNNIDISLIKIMKISKYDYEVRLNDEIKKKFKNHIIKHYARMCLARHHISDLLNNINDVKMFGKMHVGDEFFLSSITPLKKYIDFAVIHDDWDYVENIKKKIKTKIKLLYEKQEKNPKININDEILLLKNKFDDIAKNPKTIYNINIEDIKNIKNTKSFFYRKFDKNSDILNYIFNFL